MASGTYTRTVCKHGLVWWAFIGWWWRIIGKLSASRKAKDGDYKFIRTDIVDKRRMICLRPRRYTGGWQRFFGTLRNAVMAFAVWLFCVLFGYRFKFEKH